MATINKKTVSVPETGFPEITIIAVDNGWVVQAGHNRTGDNWAFDTVVAAFEKFESLTEWLAEHLEDNSHSDLTPSITAQQEVIL